MNVFPRPALSNTSFREGLNDPSPITRIIALRWYDGPTEGILQVGDDGVYAFRTHLEDIVDSIDQLDSRVYGLNALPLDSFERITQVLALVDQPRWPVWCPTWRTPGSWSSICDNEINDLLKEAGPMTWVLVGDITSGRIRAMSTSAMSSP